MLQSHWGGALDGGYRSFGHGMSATLHDIFSHPLDDDILVMLTVSLYVACATYPVLLLLRKAKLLPNLVYVERFKQASLCQDLVGKHNGSKVLKRLDSSLALNTLPVHGIAELKRYFQAIRIYTWYTAMLVFLAVDSYDPPPVYQV